MSDIDPRIAPGGDRPVAVAATKPTLSALIPVKISGRHYGDNLTRLDLMFSTLEHFLAPGLLSELLVVTRADEADIVASHLHDWSSLPIRVAVEDDVLPEFNRFTRPWQQRPWQRQQIIKLAAPDFTPADFVLVLDPDVLALKPISHASLFVGSRALLEPEDRLVHRQWWLDSASLLDVPPDLENRGMSVTPALLSQEILRQTQRRLEAVNGRPWVETLLTSYCDWTEYTLYLLTAGSTGSISNHHIWADSPGVADPLHVPSHLSIWDAKHASGDGIARLFSPSVPGLFAIVQSNAAVPVSSVRAVVSQHLPVRSVATTAIAESRSSTRLSELTRTACRLMAERLYRLRRRLRPRRAR